MHTKIIDNGDNRDTTIPNNLKDLSKTGISFVYNFIISILV